MTMVIDGISGITYPSLTTQNTAYLNSFKNRLINGNMTIDQRNAGASQTFTAAAAIAYSVDRWYVSCTGANVTGQQVAGTSPNKNAYRITGAASNTATLFGQRIESNNCSDLVSANVTGSLTVKSSSITSLTWTAYYANSADNFSSKTQIATGTITINSTATAYSLSFNAGANAANGIAIEFTTGALTATNTIQYEKVQLEVGESASSFDVRDYGRELILCQRYYYKQSSGVQYGRVATGFAGSTTAVDAQTVFPVSMRVAPTSIDVGGSLGIWQGGTIFTIFTITLTASGTTTTSGVTTSTSSGLTSLTAYSIIGNNSTTAFLAFNSEL